MPAVPGRRESGGRYGLLLLVLIGTYLFSAFSGAHLTTEVQIGLFTLVLLLAMRTLAAARQVAAGHQRPRHHRLGRRVRRRR